jgi:hypothetical protein
MMAPIGLASQYARRTWVYIQSPSEYEIAGCPCGNLDTQWSEWRGYLWCSACERDFIPEHGGIFDGPIPVNAAHLLGFSFDRINLATNEIERFQP